MSKIPCRKCKTCGRYHDLSVTVCVNCGADLKNIPLFITETEDISVENRGEINESVAFFVQKCSACGALNFTTDKNSPVRICQNCHKTRVASVKPEEYISEVPEAVSAEEPKQESASFVPVQPEVNEGPTKVTFAGADNNGSAALPWLGILGNVKEIIDTEETLSQTEKKEKWSPINKTPAPAPMPSPTPVEEDDEDDEDAVGWGDVLGKKTEPEKAPEVKRDPSITLTAIRHGDLTFTVEPTAGLQYMLGRSANQGEFLSSDGRVGNRHCYLFFRSGAWYVRDNNSANGTAVNSGDIGLGGESILQDGALLKLGHHPDSMEFKVSIK